MTELTLIMTSALTGAIWTTLILYWKGWLSKPHPYRWRCMEDGCTFTVSGNEVSMIDAWATNHERLEHPT